MAKKVINLLHEHSDEFADLWEDPRNRRFWSHLAMIRRSPKFSRAVWIPIAAVSVLLIVGLFNLSNAAGYRWRFHRTVIWVVLVS